MTSTQNCLKNKDKIEALKEAIAKADALIIGAGAGLSTSAGLEYGGARFERLLGDYGRHYGFNNMYSGAFYPFPSLEEFWGYWTKQIYHNRYEFEVTQPYYDLKALAEKKDFFVITTNGDHLFRRAGFPKERLFYTQGCYGLWQCSEPCHKVTYDNEEQVYKMFKALKDFRIPTELIPYCPKCHKPMMMNLRVDNRFVEDDGWHAAYRNYAKFLKKCEGQNIVLLELGIGGNTPSIIKYPFWDITRTNKKATYACLNLGEAHAPHDIDSRSICIDADIASILSQMA